MSREMWKLRGYLLVLLELHTDNAGWQWLWGKEEEYLGILDNLDLLMSSLLGWSFDLSHILLHLKSIC